MAASTVDGYIEKQEPKNQWIIKRLRGILFKKCPGIEEKMKWGVLGYADGTCYIVALRDHVNPGFSLKKIPKEKQKLLDSTGKETGHIEIKELGDIDERRISILLELAMAE